jgi:DNA-binding NtrC family response regulator
MDNAIGVLLVDDEEPFVRNLSRLLQNRGFRAAAALSGAEALDIIVRGDRLPDVAVLDVAMPEMDGLSLLRKLKTRHPELPVIMLTGQAALEAGIEAIRQGAFDYVMKPCDVDVLAEKIVEAHTVEEMKQHPALWPRNRVRDVMTAVPADGPETETDRTDVVARPEDHLPELAQRMINHSLRAIPVMQNGEAVGIVRLRDILPHIERETE